MTAPGEFDGLPSWAAKGTDLPMQAESSVTVRDWQDSMLDDTDRFAADLQALGLHPDDVDDGVGLMRAVSAEADDAVRAFWDRQPAKYLTAPDNLVAQASHIYQYTRDSALTKLGNWFAGRQIVVDNRELVQVRLPLFVLSTYATPGCVSTYQTTMDQSRKLGWNVTLFGSGLGGEATFDSSVSSTLTADAGQAVLVFLPVSVAIEQVRVLAKDGTVLGSGQRVDLSPAQLERPVPGGLLLDSSAVPSAGVSVQTYPLAGYGSGVADYQFVYTQQKVAQLQVGVTAYGAGVSLTGSVTMSRSVTLDFKLVGGRDYKLSRLAGADGVVWG